MAKRDISTRIILEGEREYRNAMKGIQAEYKTLQSAMKLTQAQFKEQQNTLTALSAKQKDLENVVSKLSEKLKLQQDALKRSSDLQAQFSQKAEAARKQIEEKQRRLEELRKTTDDTTKEEEELKKEIEELTKEYNLNAKNAERCKQDTEKYKDEINKTEKELVEYTDELQKNSKYLDEAKNSSNGLAQSIDETGKELKNTGEEGTSMGQNIAGAFNVIRAGLAAAGITVSLRAVVNLFKECTASAIAFESAMAGVAKTNNLEGEELEKMGNQVLELSKKMPIAATEFARIMETAGQLGVANEDLIEFSKTMANLGVATNMTADEAATMLAQFTAITGMDPSKYSNLGATVVALGNNFATTEQRVVEMSQGVAAAGYNAGLSEAEMMAFSTAVSSVGMQSAAGGTNLSGLIQKMQNAVETGEDLNLWAEACGMKTYELSALWKTNASEALLTFFQNVGQGEKPMATMLDQLGLSDKRMSRLVSSTASAERESGMLSRALGLANSAWEENNALTKEAETRYNTTQSQIQLMNNQIEATRIALGQQFTDTVGYAAGRIGDLAEQVERISKAQLGRNLADWATNAFALISEGASTFLDTLEGISAKIGDDAEKAAYEHRKMAEDHRKYWDEVTQSYYSYSNAADATADVVARLTDTYTGFSDSLKEWVADGVASNEVIQMMTDSIGEQEEALWDLDKETEKRLRTQTEYFSELIDDYDKYYEMAKNTADNAFGLFEKVDVKWTKSSKKADKEVQNLSKNLDSQSGFWTRYSENITKAMEEGIDVGLILKLADGSVENAKYLDMIVNATGDARDNLVEKFKSVDEGTKAFADAVTALKMSVSLDMDEVERVTDEAVANLNQYTDSKKNASATAQGVIDGLESKYSRAKDIVDRYKALMRSMGSGSKTASANAAGLEYVPYDNYPALLHKGEMVLTKFEAEAYRASENKVSETKISNYNTVNNGVNSNLLREVADLAGDNIVNVYTTGEVNVKQLADQIGEILTQKQDLPEETRNRSTEIAYTKSKKLQQLINDLFGFIQNKAGRDYE